MFTTMLLPQVSRLKKLKVCGEYIIPVDPDLDHTAKKQVMSLPRLQQVLEHHYDEAKQGLYLKSKFSKVFPEKYLDTVMVVASNPLSVADGMLTCHFCGETEIPVAANVFRNHVSKHLLGLAPSDNCKVLDEVYCGFCGKPDNLICRMEVHHSK